MNLPTARRVSALVRQAIGDGNASCTTRTAGVVLVVVTGNADRTQDREVLARAIAAAAIREGWDASRTGEVLTITADELPEPVEETAAPIVTVEQLVADTLNLGYPTVAAYLAAPGREVGQVTPWTLDRAERAFARAVERTRLHDDPPAPVAGLVHLMSDALLDACGTAAPGGLHLAPSTTPERITCPACRVLAAEEAAADAVVEADVPPTADERVTVRIRTRELRPGDVIVDGAGREVYHAFDVQIDDEGAAKVWTAIRDQEAGLPPVVHLHRDREVLVLRPVSEEGRELLAALDGI